MTDATAFSMITSDSLLRKSLLQKTIFQIYLEILAMKICHLEKVDWNGVWLSVADGIRLSLQSKLYSASKAIASDAKLPAGIA